MNVYELAKALTEKQVENIVNGWADNSKELKEYNSLVRLGDSKNLAVATVLHNKKTRPDNSAEYAAAYYS